MIISYHNNNLFLSDKKVIYKNYLHEEHRIKYAEEYLKNEVNNTLEFISNKRKFIDDSIPETKNWNELVKVQGPLIQKIINKDGDLEIIYSRSVKFIDI
jgi:hypothetical protein